MTEPPRRIVLEKSRSVRRRYQCSNKRFQFTASQIERIEREEEREHRAQKLREREKKRLANKKKKAEKEARLREERRRSGLPPDPAAPRVPSSQSLLSNFLASHATRQSSVDSKEVGSSGEETAFETLGGDTDTELDSCVTPEGGGELGIDASVDDSRRDKCNGLNTNDDEDEFSDCSIFYDEDIIRKAETGAISQQNTEVNGESPSSRQDAGQSKDTPSVGDSFQDETAAFLEEAFSHKFETDEEFEKELMELGTVVNV